MTSPADGMPIVKAKEAAELSGASILSLSIERWDHVWRSRHHVMSRLGQSNRVLFASLPPNLAEASEALSNHRIGASASISISGQLREYISSPWLPFNYRSAALDAVVEKLRRMRLRRELTRLGMDDPILYVWHPCFVEAIDAWRESLVVFHCYDEYSAFNSPERERLMVKRQEEQLLRRADVVIAASESLAAARRPFNPNVHVVENGVDYELFARAQDPSLSVPESIAQLTGPVIGCVLTQLTVVDVRMLIEVLSKRSSWQIAIIGMERPVDDGRSPSLTRLLSSPNLHFLGRQRLEAMPGYLKGCQVCAIPWVVNDITAASSSPLKLYEYFAAGKPIVSARLPLLSHLSRLVEFATTAEEWVAAIEHALASDDSALVSLRQKLAESNTWDHRVRSIGSIISMARAERSSRRAQH